MNKLLEALSNDMNFIKKIAAKYIDFGEFKYVELDLGIEIGSIEELFDENPDFANEFDDALQAFTIKRMRREGAHKLFKIIKSLYDVLSDDTGVEDGGPSISDKVKAANTLAKFVEVPKSKKGDKGDEIDDLLREIESELHST